MAGTNYIVEKLSGALKSMGLRQLSEWVRKISENTNVNLENVADEEVKQSANKGDALNLDVNEEPSLTAGKKEEKEEKRTLDR